MMKKLMTILVAIIAAGVFATDWFPPIEKIEGFTGHKQASKDTLWYAYANSEEGYVIAQRSERATLFNLDDFGVEYPVNLHAVTTYQFDAGYEFTYRIYDTDGVTLLWESPITLSAEQNYSDVTLDTPLVLKNDFWLSVVPNSSGFPREFAQDQATVSHSYIKDELGNWVLWTNSNSGYYENFNYVALSPYTGEDTHAPLARALYGTENFMNRDAELVLTVQDQSAVISPMQGQYDIGAGWVDFQMTLDVKANNTFRGTIPGQADGIDGMVRFYMVDEFANSSWTGNYEVSWSKDTPMFSEDFEGPVFPPEGWTLQNVGAGFTRGTVADGGFVHGGKYSSVHWDDSGAQDDWMITPPITLPSDNACTFSFWQTVFWSYYYSPCEVAISTDKVNWTTVYTPPYVADDEPIALYYDALWLPVKFSLNPWAGQTVYVGFHYTGDYSHQWYIDDIEMLYDYSGPQITEISGNPAIMPVVGGYLNNPMVINLNVTDLSGVKSITGHYDIGGQTGDVVFAQAKSVEELWTGSIPAQSAVASGTISFTLVDIGDLVTESAAYDIQFVEDNGAPVVKYLIGNETFIGSDMNLELAFDDESPILSCKGFYSKNDFVDVYEFNLAASKINEYVFAGTIPAETEEVFFNGKVYFEITDTAGNKLTTGLYTAKWLQGSIAATDDFESGLGNWEVVGKWGIEEGTYVSPSNSLTESVNSLYGNNQNTYAKWAVPMDWTLVQSASISFWCTYNIEAGFDYMYFDVSNDGGYNWVNLKSWDGDADWNKVQLPLDAAAGSSQVTFRFRFRSDAGLELNGMYIDDIEIKAYEQDYGMPTIVHVGPEYFEGVSGDFTKTVKVTDMSGVAAVKVYYTVEGIEGESVVDAVLTATADTYEFTIPGQETGKLVNYRFWAQDASVYQNAGYSDFSYEYLSGTHTLYDAGIVSYYTTTEKNDAKAVRITSGAVSPDSTKIAYALIRNYQDLGNFSATMKFHIWTDNAGVPGTDMIEPFDFESDCTPTNTSAMTRVDLRVHDIKVSDDFWIGFSAKNGIVYTTMESPGEEGTVAYNRSYDGTFNGAGWDWAVYAAANYHMRAVLGDFVAPDGIETDSNLPLMTDLSQNYPNPFNPTTTIAFNLVKDSKVSLVVYDVMGREVANLVNGEMVKGSHKVTFDASRLVSGVYYYNLKAGNMSMTKKMMLIK
jgi:hypothetical protein